jgi:hypothetical protein
MARDFASGPITATVFPSVDDFRHPAPPPLPASPPIGGEEHEKR